MADQLLFIRHAAPAPRPPAEQFVAGYDPPLAARGREQARRLAPHVAALGATRLVSSRLRRARETAALIAEGAAIPHTDALDELDEITPGALRGRWLGGLAGLDPARAPAALRPGMDAAWDRVLSTLHFAAWLRRRSRGGEDPAAVIARIERSLARLAALPEPRVAVVGHGYFIFCLALRSLPRGPRHLVALRPWVAHCSVTTLVRADAGRFRLASFARRVG
jgi:broad specificity phosphatase PhoE